LPPFHLYPLLLAFAALLDLLRHTERRLQAFVIGWCFGFAHFLLGLYWIGIAFFTDAERFGALAVPAVLLLCAFLACYPALAAWLTVAYRWRSPVASALVLAVAWTVAEIGRGVLFGGFPWNLIGYAFAQSAAISQLAALTGIYGLSLLAVLLGALPVAWLERRERPGWQPLAAVAVILVVVWAGGALRLTDAVAEPSPAVHLRLVQGNIAQHHKWQPEARARAFQRHLTLSAERPGLVTHVIWPESAMPYPIEQEPVARQMIAAVVPPDGLLLTGGERFDLTSEPPLAWNSLFAIDGAGTIRARLHA
jgi:apolipoprotein N-acyltransferase